MSFFQPFFHSFHEKKYANYLKLTQTIKTKVFFYFKIDFYTKEIIIEQGQDKEISLSC